MLECKRALTDAQFGQLNPLFFEIKIYRLCISLKIEQGPLASNAIGLKKHMIIVNISFKKMMKELQFIDENSNIRIVIRVNTDKDNIGSTYSLLSEIGMEGSGLTKFSVDFGMVM